MAARVWISSAYCRKQHDDLIPYDVCHDCISVTWGHGLYYGGSVLVAMPQLSDLVALPHISILVALPRLSVFGDFVTLSVLASMLHISVACSSWVGRVVSPHRERLVIPNHSELGAVKDSEWPHVLQIRFFFW
ncbi:Metal-dependent hydrolase [Gossypium arboreum]|uniref:Metal-dependent hydrolase n=1 Tax=Gossypium arboreum TaxID=29729 RepID=A0A0B0PBQ8_GOSAR|nr:Metal-dependent hydrolase [Gossypium arboreum]